MQQQQVLIWKARQSKIFWLTLTWKNTAVRNNGGGFYNHNRNVMTLMEADNRLLTAIESAFELLKSLKQNLVKQNNTIWFRLGLALCSQRWKN
jgi:superoxide dismutase